MSYSVTINFPNQELYKDGDTLQLSLIFNINASGSNLTWDAEDYDIICEDYGRLKYEFDLEEPFLIPGKLKLRFHDKNLYLHNFLFGESGIYQYAERQGKVELDLNSNLEFSGYMVEDSIYYDYGERTVEFTIMPKTDIINKRMVYDSDDNALNPFNYTLSSYPGNVEYIFDVIVNDIYDLVNNKISTVNSTPTAGGSGYAANDILDVAEGFGGKVKVDTVDGSGGVTSVSLHQAGYGGYTTGTGKETRGGSGSGCTINITAVTTSTTLDFYHDWLFDGYRTTDNNRVSTFDIEDLKVDPTMFYDETDQGSRTLGDILRQICIDFCCYTGMVNQDEAFIKKLFYYDSSNTQSVIVLNHWKNYRYGLIDYVRITTDDTNDGDSPYEAGIFTELSSRIIEKNAFVYCYGGPASGYTRTQATIAAGADAGDYNIFYAKDADLSTAWKNFGELIADFWFSWRHDIENTRVDKFLLSGVDYSFLKNFTHDSHKYQIISMEKDWDRLETTIEAINLGT